MEYSRKFAQKNLLLRQEMLRKVCGNFAEIFLRFVLLQWPFPNDPMSELLRHSQEDLVDVSEYSCSISSVWLEGRGKRAGVRGRRGCQFLIESRTFIRGAKKHMNSFNLSGNSKNLR